MIETPTVFVLGAGASIPYGYPSGEKLREEICHELEDPSHSYGRMLQRQGYSPNEILEFRNNFFYSGKSSIDAYLEHNKEFIDIGKLVIARSLIPHEDLDYLFQKVEGRFQKRSNDKWYDYFYNRFDTSFDEFDTNEFSVITFNYDRSFEQFLFTALKYSYNKSDKECSDLLKKIPIVHVHGKLDDLDWQNPNGRPYDANVESDELLKKSADGIKIIHENIDNSKSFKEAQKLLERSHKIQFLGFGYNKTNLERLKILNFTNKTIQGTCVGLADAEKGYVTKLFHESFKSPIQLLSGDTLGYLKTNFYFE